MITLCLSELGYRGWMLVFLYCILLFCACCFALSFFMPLFSGSLWTPAVKRLALMSGWLKKTSKSIMMRWRPTTGIWRGSYRTSCTNRWKHWRMMNDHSMWWLWDVILNILFIKFCSVWRIKLHLVCQILFVFTSACFIYTYLHIYFVMRVFVNV